MDFEKALDNRFFAPHVRTDGFEAVFSVVAGVTEGEVCAGQLRVQMATNAARARREGELQIMPQFQFGFLRAL